MADLAEERLNELRAKALKRRSGATTSASEEAPTQAEAHQGEGETMSATRGATDVATRAATSGALRSPVREETVRRAYTLFRRQDDILRELAHELQTDKSDILRQIVDAWLASLD